MVRFRLALLRNKATGTVAFVNTTVIPMNAAKEMAESPSCQAEILIGDNLKKNNFQNRFDSHEFSIGVVTTRFIKTKKLGSVASSLCRTAAVYNSGVKRWLEVSDSVFWGKFGEEHFENFAILEGNYDVTFDIAPGMDFDELVNSSRFEKATAGIVYYRQAYGDNQKLNVSLAQRAHEILSRGFPNKIKTQKPKSLVPSSLSANWGCW